jgi:hypothetical protein
MGPGRAYRFDHPAHERHPHLQSQQEQAGVTESNGLAELHPFFRNRVSQ